VYGYTISATSCVNAVHSTMPRHAGSSRSACLGPMATEVAVAPPNGGSRSLPVATSGDRFCRALGYAGLVAGDGQAGPDLGCQLSRCPAMLGGDVVGRMAVQAGPCPVVAHGRARVGVRGGLLDVAQRDPGVEGGGDERVSQRVRADVLGDPGAAGDRRTIRAAPCRSSLRPSAATKSGPSFRSSMARSMARAVRGARGWSPPCRPCV
jgi:hypothetical protein